MGMENVRQGCSAELTDEWWRCNDSVILLSVYWCYIVVQKEKAFFGEADTVTFPSESDNVYQDQAAYPFTPLKNNTVPKKTSSSIDIAVRIQYIPFCFWRKAGREVAR